MLYTLHKDNPEKRLIDMFSDILTRDGVIAIPTSSGYALACKFDSFKAMKQIRQIRQLTPAHDFTLICSDFKQAGKFISITSTQFRVLKSLDLSGFTFILNPSKDIKKYLLTPKKTIGIRLQSGTVLKSLLQVLDEPVLSVSCIIPPSEEVENDPEVIDSKIGKLIDGVLDIGPVHSDRTTVIDWTSITPVIVRKGIGDISPFA
jgi:tRNA threonylcarbamoyl adenosine modification protein (Sua5/YciO/YrdC/YwlC family)